MPKGLLLQGKEAITDGIYFLYFKPCKSLITWNWQIVLMKKCLIFIFLNNQFRLKSQGNPQRKDEYLFLIIELSQKISKEDRNL